MYSCKTPSCAISLSQALFPTLINCPVCQNVLTPNIEISYSKEEQMIMDNYPYVVAFPFSKMLKESHPLEKVNLLVDTFQNTLKYLALVLATEYFESDLKNDVINTLFKNKLFRYSLGDLNHFIREIIKELNNENYQFFLTELQGFYKQITSGKPKYKIEKSFTNTLGEKKVDVIKLHAVDALLNFRNKEISHTTTKSSQRYLELYELYNPILLDLLCEMNFVVNYPMYKRDKGGVFELMGTEISLFQKTELQDDDFRMWLQNKNNSRLLLSPFFILPKLHFASVDDSVELFIYEENAGSRLVYLSPESKKEETSGQIVKQFQLLLEAKKVKNNYTKATLTNTILASQIALKNKQVLEDLIKERKVYLDIYQEREDAELNLRMWLGSRFGLYLLMATSGSGKTNLLVEMTKQYKKLQVSNILLRANRCDTANFETELKVALDLHENYNFNHFKTLGFTQENPFVVLIDGVNEHNTPELFITTILEFLKTYKNGYIKVVVSWRADLKNELPKVDNKYTSLIYTVKQDNNENHLLAKAAQVLKPLNEKELEQAWCKYSNNTSNLFNPNFLFEELILFDEKLTDEIKKPLYLKLFLQLYHKKFLPKEKGFINLWQKYSLAFRNQPEQYKLLKLLIEIMFKTEKHSLTTSVIFANNVLKKYVNNKDISGPYEQLKHKGVLVEYFKHNERFVSFVVEGFYYYLLGEYLYETYDKNKPSQLLTLLKSTSLKNIFVGLQECLLLDVYNKEYFRLIWLIDNCDEIDIEFFILPLAQAFVIGDVKIIFDLLFENSTVQVFMIINKVVTLLQENRNVQVLNILYPLIKDLEFHDIQFNEDLYDF